MSRPSLHNFTIVAFTFIFAAAFAAAIPTAHAQIGLDFLNLPPGAEIGTILSRLYVFGVSMVVIAALIMFTIGGVQYMITGGDRDPGPAKQRMKDALFGLILALTSYLILFTINPDLVREVKLKTVIIDLINPADLSQAAQEGEPCGGTPKDPKHPESVTCATGSCIFNKAECKPASGNETGVCMASCKATPKLTHGQGPCNVSSQCETELICFWTGDPPDPKKTCKTVTSSTPPGVCLKANCK